MYRLIHKNGTAEEGTNFLDLLHSVLRDRNLRPPVGYNIFQSMLNDLNVPRELVNESFYSCPSGRPKVGPVVSPQEAVFPINVDDDDIHCSSVRKRCRNDDGDYRKKSIKKRAGWQSW